MKVFIARQGPFDLIIDYNTLSIGRRAQAIMQDIPRIYDLADDLADMIRISPQMNSLIAPFAARFARRMILKSVRKAQIVTGTTKPLLDKYEVPSEKGKVIHNGIPANFIEPVEQSEIIDCRKRQEEFLIGYVGVLREWVDFKPIFESIKNLQPTIPIRLIIIGEEGEKDKVIAQADKAGVLSSVSMVGTISHNKIRRYLAACDCGIVPFALTQTSEYALPLKVFEYLSAGIPVISSGIRAIKEDFADIVWLYEDEKSLRNAILEIESNKNMVKEKVNRGMEKVRVDYTWTGIMRKFDLLIEKVT
jgi:glycosyltransferase involved in cell wall biosynthesis